MAISGRCLGVGLRVEQPSILDGGVAEGEARDVEARIRERRAAHRDAGAARRVVLVESELPDDQVRVQDLTRPHRQAAAELHGMAAGHARDVVEDLIVVLVGDQRLVAVRSQVPGAAVLEHELTHGRGGLIQVDAGDTDRLRQVLPVVERRHVELDRRPADAELVEPPGPECVRVVDRQPLRLDVAVPGAKREARVAVRQRRRQEAVRLLIAVANEEAVVVRQVVIDLAVDLVVVALERRVDQVVVDRLPGRAPLAACIRRRIQLLDDVA